MGRVSNKSYILSFIILFGISTALLPAWGGYLDVGIVVLLAFTGIAVRQRDKSTPRYDISHQVAVYLFPIVLVGMWLYRNSLDFNILLPGLAWRTYLFLSILPHGLDLWKPE